MTVSGETLRSISAPERLDSRLGTLDFVDGCPSPATSGLVYDHLDFVHGLNAYLNGFPGASTQALVKGLHEAGVEDNAIRLCALQGREDVTSPGEPKQARRRARHTVGMKSSRSRRLHE